MLCWPGAEASWWLGPAGWLAAAALLLVNAGTGASVRAEDRSGFEVREVGTRLEDGFYLLDARIDFQFSAEAREAMDNGVPITVIVDVEIRRQGRFWGRQVAALTDRYRIENHALTNRYVIRRLASGEARTYGSYAEMVAALGTIDDLPLVDHLLIEADEAYRLRLQVRLDIEALPSPLRLVAYLSSLWRLESDWHEWPLTP
jgi:hypothetical protein